MGVDLYFHPPGGRNDCEAVRKRALRECLEAAHDAEENILDGDLDNFSAREAAQHMASAIRHRIRSLK